ncbi:MAG: DUF5671 domain-containing protein [Dichotomicrobium sp.]
MDQRLVDFTRQALTQGRGRNDIRQALHGAGWPPEDIDAALGEFADIDFPVPVPRPKPYLSAREVFLYLVFFAALYASALAVGNIGFRFVDVAFPDPVEGRGHGYFSQIRWSLASLLVCFPLFLVALRAIEKQIPRNPQLLRSPPRRWLTYMTLFIAGLVLSGDMITLIYNALGGELTIRFVLKVAIVGVIAGGIFAYFFGEMRRDEQVAAQPSDERVASSRETGA